MRTAQPPRHALRLLLTRHMAPAQWRGTSRPTDRQARLSWILGSCLFARRRTGHRSRVQRRGPLVVRCRNLSSAAERGPNSQAPSCPHSSCEPQRIVIHRSSAGRLFRLFITKGEAERRGVFRPKWRFAFSLLLPRLFRGGSKEVV